MKAIKELATTITLIFAAGIGSVLLLSATGIIGQHPTLDMRPEPHAATRIVVCDSYLSLGAMRSANAAGIPEASSFCTAS